MRPVIVDAHSDLLHDVYRLRKEGKRRVIEQHYLNDVRASGINVLICSLFVPDSCLPESALRYALTQIGTLHREIEESPGQFELCRRAGEVKSAVEAGKIALLLSFEGVEPIGNDLLLLYDPSDHAQLITQQCSFLEVQILRSFDHLFLDGFAQSLLPPL